MRGEGGMVSIDFGFREGGRGWGGKVGGERVFGRHGRMGRDAWVVAVVRDMISPIL